MDISKIAKAIGKYKYILAVLAVGLMLMSFPDGNKDTVTNEKEIGDFDVKKLETRIEDALASCEGVGRAEVILSLNSGTERIYAKEAKQSVREESDTTESDSDTKPSIMSGGSGRETPVIVKEVYPEFRGALVVCDGAESASIRLQVTEAVMSLTGLSSDRVSVVKMK